MGILDDALNIQDAKRSQRLLQAARKAKIEANKIKEGTYRGIDLIDGTAKIQLDDQPIATSGYRLITNAPLGDGDRVSIRPNSVGLPRADAKNVAPQKAVADEVVDILEYYIAPNFINNVNMTELTEYTISLDRLGTGDLSINLSDLTGVSFMLNGEAFSAVIGDNAISFSGDSATFGVMFEPTVSKNLTLLFYNGNFDKKGELITRSSTLFQFYSFNGNASSLFNIYAICGKDFTKISSSYKSKVKLKSAMPDSYSAEINAQDGILTLNGNDKATIKFTGYPIQINGQLSSPLSPIGTDVATFQLTDGVKGRILKKLNSTTIKSIANTGRLTYAVALAGGVPSLVTAIGDFLFPNLDVAGTETAYSGSLLEGANGHYSIPFRTDYYNNSTSILIWKKPEINDGTLVTITNSAPLPLVVGGSYYFYSVGDNAFYLSETDGGDAITITGSGSGNLDWDVALTEGNYYVNGLSANVQLQSGFDFDLSVYGLFVEFRVPYWDAFITRYFGTAERVQIEFTYNENIQTTYLSAGTQFATIFMVPSGIVGNTLDMSIRFKRESSSTWFVL